MDPTLVSYAGDWLHLVGRWVHLVAAIAWVGASLYFIALDHSLRSPEEDDGRGVGGEAWEIHGGGFYRIEKFRVAPPRLPSSLRWFKWEAYITGLSGFALLVLLYYVDPYVLLIDPTVADLQPWQAIGASLALLGLGWVVYDGLSGLLAHRERALAVAIVVLVVTVAWIPSLLFGPRAAYLHSGAVIGTWMVANVLFVIIPGQRELVAAKQADREPDPIPGLRGKQRSVHNNYLTLPVVFAMISQHFPFTYGHQYAWLVLLGLMAAGAAAQHALNLQHRGQSVWPAAGTAALLVAGVAVAVAPPAALAGFSAKPLTAEETAQVAQVFVARCTACHATRPTHPDFTSPPRGLVLETKEQIRASSRRIYEQVVLTRLMPLGNQTGMTEDERELIARWVRTGAPLP